MEILDFYQIVIDDPPINDPSSPDDSGPDLHLAPSDLDKAHELEEALTRPCFESNEPPPDPRSQFSLGEFMAWIGLVSIGLSGLIWIGPPIFAGVCGFLALGALIITLVWNPNAPSFRLAWYALLVMYLIAILIAFLFPHDAAR